MERNIICQVCPMACEINIGKTEKDPVITGNRCGRGFEFANKYLESGEKIVTGRCLLKGGQMSRLPVATSKKVPAMMMDQILQIIQKHTVHAPIQKGQIIIENILGTGVDIVSQRKSL